jgi:hypothetical protein
MELTQRRRATTVVAGLAALAMVSALSLRNSQAVFTATTANDGNSFATGTVVLSNSGAAGGTLSVANMRPGSFIDRCVDVTYTGTLATDPITVAVTGDGGLLASALTLEVREGAPDSTCATLLPGDGTVLGTTGPLGSGRTLTGAWAMAKDGGTQQRAYRFRVELPLSADNTVMGQSTSVDVSWSVATPSTAEDLS